MSKVIKPAILTATLIPVVVLMAVLFSMGTPASGAIAASKHTINIDAVNLDGVAISGPSTGMAQVGYIFAATVSPVTTTLPITYVWGATGQPPVTHTGGLSDTVAFTWNTPGVQTISATAVSAGNPVTATHVITIAPGDVYLPIVMNGWPPIPPKRIAFVSDRDGNWEIYVMNTDGTEQTRLTNDPGEDSCPDWSPDGSKIAFTSERDGNLEIYVMNADGTGQTNLTNHPAGDGCPAWSPDGTKIAFDSERDGQWDIFVMNADGSGATRLTDCGSPCWTPDWSPDGSKVVYWYLVIDFEMGLFNGEIYVMNSDGTGQINLTNSPEWDDFAPNWSPDGSKIAFGSSLFDGNHSDVFIMNPDGTGKTNLTDNPDWEDDDPTWSSDGTRIAFVSYRDFFGEIYVMNADGTGQTNLTNHPAREGDPAW